MGKCRTTPCPYTGERQLSAVKFIYIFIFWGIFGDTLEIPRPKYDILKEINKMKWKLRKWENALIKLFE